MHLNALILQLQLIVGNKLLLTVVTLIPKHFNKHWEDEIESRSLICKIHNLLSVVNFDSLVPDVVFTQIPLSPPEAAY